MINFFMLQPLRSQEVSTDETTTLINESFIDIPVDWTNNGFTRDNGMEVSGTGGMSTNLIFDHWSYLDRMTESIDVVVNDITSSFAIGKDQTLRGNLAKVDFDANTLELGILVTSGTEPTYDFSTTLDNITKEVGATYTLEFTRNREIVSCKIYKTDTPDIYDEIVRDYDIDNTFAGSAWGYPYAVFFSGDIKITNFTYKALNDSTVKVAMYGDSITEGQTMVDQVNNVKNRWADKVWVANFGNAYISARGGFRAAHTAQYIDFEYEYLKATYTIFLLGSNDTNFDTWQTSIDSLIQTTIDNGGTPILCTIPPRDSVQDFINEANTYILDTLSLTYDIIDFAASVTDDRDRLTWTDGYQLDDGVHPTISGHLAMYNEIVNYHSYLL